jgi:hypothetical protein
MIAALVKTALCNERPLVEERVPICLYTASVDEALARASQIGKMLSCAGIPGRYQTMSGAAVVAKDETSGMYQVYYVPVAK